MNKLEQLYAEYGKPGSAIEGSKLVRDYCRECGEPMRVYPGETGSICVHCLYGAPESEEHGPADDEQENGWWSNGVRALEGD